MKKIIVGILVFSSIISTLSPLSAFANSEDEPFKQNAFGVVPYNERMFIRSKNEYSHDLSNIEFINNHKASNPHYTGKFDPRVKLGGVLCGDAQRYTTHNQPRTSIEEIRIIKLACDAWIGKYKSILTISKYPSYNYYNEFKFIFYTGQDQGSPFKDTKIVRHHKNDKTYPYYNGFFVDSNSLKDFYVVSGSIFSNSCYSDYCSASMADIKLFASELYFNHQSYGDNELSKIFLFGRDDYSKIHTPVFNTFTIQYPEGYSDEDQIKTSPNIIKKIDWYPRAGYSIKDKNLRAMIYNRSLGDEKTPLLDSNFYQSCFELYPENSEEEKDRIFRYCGSTLFDNFVYDFEHYGVYKLKTFIQPKPPLTLEHKLVNIIQPAWARLEVNGGNYSFLPTQSSQCSGAYCDTPTYALSCGAVNDTIEKAVSCEFNKMDNFFRKKIGLLYIPVDVIGRLVNNFKNASGVSCSFVIDGKIPLNVCMIETKMPALLTFIRMVANGSLLIAFVLFLRSSLVGFLNSKGDE